MKIDGDGAMSAIEKACKAYAAERRLLEQALSILDVLERLPVGSRLNIDKANEGRWFASLNMGPEHWGESLTDALGQLTTVISLEGRDEGE